MFIQKSTTKMSDWLHPSSSGGHVLSSVLNKKDISLDKAVEVTLSIKGRTLQQKTAAANKAGEAEEKLDAVKAAEADKQKKTEKMNKMQEDLSKNGEKMSAEDKAALEKQIEDMKKEIDNPLTKLEDLQKKWTEAKKETFALSGTTDAMLAAGKAKFFENSITSLQEQMAKSIEERQKLERAAASEQTQKAVSAIKTEAAAWKGPETKDPLAKQSGSMLETGENGDLLEKITGQPIDSGTSGEEKSNGTSGITIKASPTDGNTISTKRPDKESTSQQTHAESADTMARNEIKKIQEEYAGQA